MKSKCTGDLLPIAKAAQNLAFFVKHNEYPEVGGDGFHKVTELFNKLEVELTKAGMSVNKAT